MTRSNWSCSTPLKVSRSAPRLFIAFFISMKILDDILDISDDIFVNGGLWLSGRERERVIR